MHGLKTFLFLLDGMLLPRTVPRIFPLIVSPARPTLCPCQYRKSVSHAPPPSSYERTTNTFRLVVQPWPVYLTVPRLPFFLFKFVFFSSFYVLFVLQSLSLLLCDKSIYLHYINEVQKLMKERKRRKKERKKMKKKEDAMMILLFVQNIINNKILHMSLIYIHTA